jgi:dolichol-phosphate mannosyltransferase
MPFPVKQFIKFGIVGGSGVVVNAGLFRLFFKYGGLDYRVASIIAIEIAIINNFFWNYLWTFRERRTKSFRDMLYALVRFNVSSGLTALVVNWGILVLLKEMLGMYEEGANLIGIAAGTLANFLMSHLWAFKPRKV